MIGLFTVVVIKITNVMLFEEEAYESTLKKLTYTQVSGTSSPRGRIYDRNYNIIVDIRRLFYFGGMYQ